MFLKLAMQHQGLKLNKVYINNELWMTLTYFTARSTRVAYRYVCIGETVSKLFDVFQGRTFTGNTKSSVLWVSFCVFEKVGRHVGFLLVRARARLCLYSSVRASHGL